jgi:hypothetical protein
MPQAGRTAAQRQSSNGALVFRVDDDGPMRQLMDLCQVGARRHIGSAQTFGQLNFRKVDVSRYGSAWDGTWSRRSWQSQRER